MTSTRTTRARYGAAAVALAPAVMLAAFAAHPFIARLPDTAAVADAVETNTTSWGVVHLLTGVGSALIALAFLAIRAHLREVGEERFSTWALPWVIVGSALYGFLPGLEFAPLAAARTGGDVVAVQAALQPWFVLVLATSAITFAVGVLGFAKGIAASGLLNSPLTRVVVTGLVVLALTRFVPLAAVQFYLQAAAGLVALWPLAYQMWEHPQPTQVGQRQMAPAG
jgi:MFS family permease